MISFVVSTLHVLIFISFDPLQICLIKTIHVTVMLLYITYFASENKTQNIKDGIELTLSVAFPELCVFFYKIIMSQNNELWFLSHRRTANALASLHKLIRVFAARLHKL